MDKEINNNGYGYVDLGLPSGTLWATCNVGAKKPSDYGLYFQWGDIDGFTTEQVGKDKQFSRSDYKFSIDGSSSNFSEYTTTGATLELEDDAANANMGGSWHMPTPTQIQELIDNTTNTWTAQDGVNGRLFTSKSDSSRSIFVPAAGCAYYGSVYFSGSYGSVWSSVLDTVYVGYGQGLYFDSSSACLGYYYRCNGCSVRGVIDKNEDDSKGNKNNMNEKLDLIEILKNAPRGTKLWSPVYGECTFLKIDERRLSHSKYPVICETHRGSISFTKEGKIFDDNNDTECFIFPSKDNRDWSKFKVSKPHKHFEPF